ncbi:MAG: ASPIC/UnbV domain-containing protein, partial [Myxococcales bacterium]|nr:ASPIC/UnbV domain-containing protein [Myxococcales bacterium]
GLVDEGQGRGLISFDYDRDGDLDIFLANQGGKPKLFRNDSLTGNHWLQVDVRGSVSNRDGLGARIEVVTEGQTQLFEVGAGSTSYLGHSQRTAHFGVGAATTVELVRVRWPASGQVQEFTQVAADQVMLVTEN